MNALTVMTASDGPEENFFGQGIYFLPCSPLGPQRGGVRAIAVKKFLSHEFITK